MKSLRWYASYPNDCFGGIQRRESGDSERRTDSPSVGPQEKPEVAVFDDLADLFKADPIHDVEENAGWPLVRQD